MILWSIINPTNIPFNIIKDFFVGAAFCAAVGGTFYGISLLLQVPLLTVFALSLYGVAISLSAILIGYAIRLAIEDKNRR